MSDLVNFIDFCKHAYYEFDGSNVFQTVWDRSNKSLGKFWNAEKHLIGTVHR